MIWFASDYHLDHENIIKFSERPYANIGEMNKDICDTTNKYVMPNDLFVFNGDLSLGVNRDDELGYIKSVQGYLEAINCKNVLWVGGNHDRLFVKRHGELVKNLPVWKMLRWRTQCSICLNVCPNKEYKGKCSKCGGTESEPIEGVYPMGLELRLSSKLCGEHKLPALYKDILITCTHYSMRVWNRSHHNRKKVEEDKLPRSINLYGHSHGELPGIFCSFDCGWDVWRRPINVVEVLEKFMPEHNKTEAAQVYFGHHNK